MSYREGIRKMYCHKCDKTASRLCKACLRVSDYNKDSVPIGYNKNYIEPIFDEY